VLDPWPTKTAKLPTSTPRTERWFHSKWWSFNFKRLNLF